MLRFEKVRRELKKEIDNEHRQQYYYLNISLNITKNDNDNPTLDTIESHKYEVIYFI